MKVPILKLSAQVDKYIHQPSLLSSAVSVPLESTLTYLPVVALSSLKMDCWVCAMHCVRLGQVCVCARSLHGGAKECELLPQLGVKRCRKMKRKDDGL